MKTTAAIPQQVKAKISDYMTSIDSFVLNTSWMAGDHDRSRHFDIGEHFTNPSLRLRLGAAFKLIGVV